MVLPGVGVVPLAVPPPAHDPQQMEHAQYPVTRNLPRYVPLEELLLSVLSCAEALAPEPDVLELLLELWLLLAVLCCLAASSAAALAAAGFDDQSDPKTEKQQAGRSFRTINI